MSRRGFGITALLAAAYFAGPAETAEAQLLPNLPIRRQRVERPLEPPFYSQVRQNYYGYYPTCWQRFPDGWACPCPNPEAPDLARAFKDRPRDERPKVDPIDGGDPLGPLPEGGAAPGDGGGRQRPINVPPVPGGTRSPFELDTRKPGDPDANPDLAPPSDSGRLRDLPRPGDATPPAGTQPTPPAGGAAPRPMPPAGAPGASPFEPRADRSAPGLPEITMPGPASSDAPGRGRPLLDTPTLGAAPTAGSNDIVSIQPFPSSLPPGTTSDAPPPAASNDGSAPKRPSMIGGLLNNLNRRRR